MDFILNNLGGILTLLGFAVALVFFIIKAVKSKNWRVLVSYVLELMSQAEKLFNTGAERKKWVIDMIESSSEKIGYKLKTEDLSKLIDELCKMSKKVNVKSLTSKK